MLCLHFGHCEQFALIDIDANTKNIDAVEMLTPPPHEPGILPKWLHEQNVDLVIAGGMGQRARSLFARHGIETIVGASEANPTELAEAWLRGTLQSGQNICDH
jgi:predicted Fe-Mo cluster-binding NifX family protein